MQMDLLRGTEVPIDDRPQTQPKQTENDKKKGK